jgi:anti-sigma factor RsiW
VNPQLHDEFVALCALFYSGEITDEEWALLQVHLAYCDSCREEFEQYKQIHRDVIPLMAASAAGEFPGANESPAGFAKAERDLLERAITRPETQKSAVRKRPGYGWGIALAACAGGVIVFAGMHLWRERTAQAPPLVPTARATVSAPASPAEPRDPGTLQALKQDQEEIAKLRQQIVQLQKQSTDSGSAAASLRQQLASEQAKRDEMANIQSALNSQLVSAQTQVEDLRQKLASSQAMPSQQSSEVAALEAKVHRLDAALGDANTALDDKDRMMALDKDLLAHDRDIRDLMGARNLYIADIFDTTESGKTAKPFGRIFYTRDRSLIFYGFDLEKQPGAKQEVAFQAWGTGADRQPVSLGLFYQDDGHKRWVLRCDDAKTLARLNMVFVTVEPPGGSNHPTGKQLLRAYLQIQPNHP